MEPALQECDVWTPDLLAPDLARDLDDLGAAPREMSVKTPQFAGLSAQLGALYVLEGSSLGARVLYQRALDLGMTPDFGARALFRQTQDKQRWKRFVALLEHAPDIDFDDARQAALQVFELACTAYSEPDREPA
ncbi:biliverdin-producing heme oxygenase [Mesorhizobium sp. CAU 1741]|uniref:biliverdin-producing heme oxygenase n=1 Tax=Mesorhizobium sp. CAU 1741 TaxID=3140366 RepID=UPI00325BA1E5